MAEGAVQTSQLLPRHVISALAFDCVPAHLAHLEPRLERGDRGWSLIWRYERRLHDASVAVAEALGLQHDGLQRVQAARRDGVQTRALGDEMIRYLIWRDFSNELDAPALSGERLVVVPDMKRAQMLALLGQINTHATCARAAILEQAQGGNITLFHLRDDPRRGSTLSLFLEAYRGLSVPVLKAYKTQQGTAFLPVDPPRDSLAAVAQLIHDVPTLFGRVTASVEGWTPEALLFAVARDIQPAGTSQPYDVWYDIRNARFFGSAAFMPAADRPNVLVAAPAQKSKEALTALQRKLHDPSGEFARPLTLRPAVRQYAQSEDKAELVALEADRRVLDRRIRAAKAQLVRPSIMVVAQEDDFKAMAQLLRQIVGQEEYWNDVRYSYLSRAPGTEKVADSGAHEPYHIFHFGADPAMAVQLRASLRAYENLSFYWSDPSWASLYGSAARVEVMVPFMHRLAPFPHSWEADELDAYLREMVYTWSDGRITLATGERQVLQFLPSETADGTLRLEVFRGSDLYPLNGKTLTWFNAVLAQAGGEQADALRLAMDETDARAALTNAQSARAREVAEDAEAAQKAAMGQIEKAWSGFSAALNEDLNDRMSHIKARAKEIEKIEEMAETLEKRFKTVKDNLDAMQRDANSFANRTNRIPRTQSQEIDAFLSLLSKRDESFEQAVSRAEAQINRMQETLSRLRSTWFK